MNNKKLGKTKSNTNIKRNQEKKVEKRYPIPSWVNIVGNEKDLCPDCFKVVGERSRYNVVCMLGKTKDGMTVGEIAKEMKLRQPTITHHLQVLHSVNAVEVNPKGREKFYKLNRDAHCFEECKIPY